MNKELLKELYKVYSPSGNTKKMRRFLKKCISERGANFVQDAKGDLYVTKGVSDTYPCLACHIDQVSHHTHPKDFRCIEDNGIIMGWSDKLLQQCGLGADDKNGIFICLNALEKFDTLKVAFFVDEEIGCVGSNQADMSFFENVRFVIEPDRRGGTDFINNMSGYDVCSLDFLTDTDYSEYGYKEEEGTVTDVLTLLENGLSVSCLNLSCGYYHPHTDNEVTVLSELANCQKLVFHIIEKMIDVYTFHMNDFLKYADSWASYGEYYDMDFDSMCSILENQPNISFEDVAEQFCTFFWNQDKQTLKELYEQAKERLSEYSFNKGEI